MWTAHCSYVSQLLPPKVYVQANQVMLDDTLNNPNRDDFSCLRPRVPEQHNHVGLQRYAPERWIFDHPNVNPCSVFPMRLADAPMAFPTGLSTKMDSSSETRPSHGSGRKIWFYEILLFPTGRSIVYVEILVWKGPSQGFLGVESLQKQV